MPRRTVDLPLIGNCPISALADRLVMGTINGEMLLSKPSSLAV
jgi:hypothetical protein